MRRILVVLLFAAVIPQGLFAQAAKESDKVDLKAIEEKYWAAKDDDLGVVQNRAFSKTGRIYGSIGTGPIINDEWLLGQVYHLSFGYFFTEHWGVELGYQQGQLKKNDGVDRIAIQNGLQPDHNKFLTATSIYGIWVPFYGKMSLVDTKIVYFDMQFALGLGNVSYENQIDPSEGSNSQQNALGVSFDITQHYFFSNHFAVRVDLRNRWSTQKLQKFRLSGSSATGRELGDKKQQDTSLQIGLTFFY